MRFNNILLPALVAVAVAGCASVPVPPLNLAVEHVDVTQKKIGAELRSIVVTIAPHDEQTGKITAGVEQLIPQLWQTSLTESINRMTIFQDDAPKKVNLSVKILQLDAPGPGGAMTTNATARYEILDRKNGDIIYTQDISTSSTIPFDYAFQGLTRMRESINRALQANILQFLQALETVDINKPMFPAKVSEGKK